jgi:hypothetical protein
MAKSVSGLFPSRPPARIQPTRGAGVAAVTKQAQQVRADSIQKPAKKGN